MIDDDGVEAEEREEALWRLATSLAGSVTPDEIAESLVHEGGSATGGTFANLAMVTPGSGVVRVLYGQASGRDPAAAREFDLGAAVPACEAIRSGLPVLLGSIDEISQLYPAALPEVVEAGLSARATLPLHDATGEVQGAIGFGWTLPQDFDAPQLRRLDLVAQLAALAVGRSLRVESGSGQRELGRALETMPDAFFSVDTDFRIIEANAAGARLLQLTREQLTGRNLLDFPELAGREFEAQCRRAMSMEQPLVFEEYLTPRGTWSEVHAWPARRGLHLSVSDVGDRRELERRRLSADAATDINRINRMSTMVAEHLVGSADRTEVFERLTRVLVPALADWCTITIPEDEALIRVAARHADPPRNDLVQRLVGSYPHRYSGPSPGVVVYRNRVPLRLAHLVEEINRDLDSSIDSTAYGRTLRLLGDGPGLITPVLVDGEVHAVITMIRCTEDAFSDQDEAVMIDVASHVAVALDSADHVQNQHETALALQAAALPASLPASDGLRVAAGYRPASEGGQVGGDWYDSFVLETGRIVLAVGDVAGHGIGAAALTVQMRNVLRAHLFSGIGPLESLSRLSHLIATQEPGALATIVCAEVDPVTGEVTWASAGHPAPIVVSSAGHSVYLPGRPVLPIGCTAPSHPEGEREHHLVLEPGARLLMFTDGLFERRQIDLDIGLAHLMILAEQSLGRPHPEDACAFILDGMLTGVIRDDACLLVAERR
jgi:PAS domain S-box-containing protein